MDLQKRVVVLYGSQTGTAQEMAEGLWRQLRRFNFTGPVMAMDDYEIRNLIKEQFVIFVCATTGDGEEPDNMKKFWKFLLRKSLPSNSLSLLNFAVLGLGDSTYSKFNYPAKKLNKRLLQLGGNQLIDIGLCDYQHDLSHDSIAEPWMEKLWVSLKLFFINAEFTIDRDVVPVFVPRWKISKNQGLHEQFSNSVSLYQNDSESENIEQFVMKLKSNTRTTSEEHFQDVRLLEFEAIDKPFYEYEVGDVLYVRPKNSKNMIERFFKIFENHDLNLKSDDLISISEIYSDMPVPKIFSRPIRLIKIVEEFWDLSAIPKKYAFSILGNVSENTLEKNKCIEFCSPEGQEELFNYCNRPRRNIIEVLEDFHHSTSSLTLESLFELFACVKPRAFSIASSCKAVKNNQIDLLVAVVNYYSKLKHPRLGLCSNWLKELNVGDNVLGWIKKGTFVFPKDENTPVIMIGPGTGLAPFRSLIMEKEFLNNAVKENLVLVFGCRNELGDFHCSDYLKTMHENQRLNLICAFSRDQAYKIYVQHKIEENGSLVWNLINKGGYIFVAGNSKDMPEAVKSSIKNVIAKEGSMSEDDSEKYFKDMQEKDRIQLETW